jgi:hypothetical protein
LEDGSLLSAPFNEGPARRLDDRRDEPTEVLPSTYPAPTVQAESQEIVTRISPTPDIYREAQTPESKQKKGRFWLVTGLIVVVSVLLASTFLIYSYLNSTYLGQYKGELSELCPKSLGKYRMTSSFQDEYLKELFAASDALAARYSKDDHQSNAVSFLNSVHTVKVQAPALQSGTATILLLKFASIEEAEDGITKLKSLLSDASIIESGEKRKGAEIVGKRLLITPHNNLVRNEANVLPDGGMLIRTQAANRLQPNLTVVAWTNGSVMFLAQASDALDIESAFPY